MHQLVKHLEEHYDLQIAHIEPASRGLVAETFRIRDTQQRQWFIKCCSNQLFKSHVVHSAPAHAALARCVPAIINHPLWTTRQQGVSYFGNTTVTVSTFIDAPLNEQYATTAFGRLIGRIHQSTAMIAAPMQQITRFEHDGLFRHLWHKATSEHEHPWQQELSQRLNPYVALVATQYRTLQHLQATVAQHPTQPMVITHGDAGGNVIGHTNQDLHIIDWDYVGLAHPERDLWVFQYDEGFWQGYQEVVGAYPRSTLHLRNAAYRQYFDYVVYILSEIYVRTPTAEQRVAHMNNLLSLFDESNWIQVHLT